MGITAACAYGRMWMKERAQAYKKEEPTFMQRLVVQQKARVKD
jgi:hypothetical protein